MNKPYLNLPISMYKIDHPSINQDVSKTKHHSEQTYKLYCSSLVRATVLSIYILSSLSCSDCFNTSFLPSFLPFKYQLLNINKYDQQAKLRNLNLQSQPRQYQSSLLRDSKYQHHAIIEGKHSSNSKARRRQGSGHLQSHGFKQNLLTGSANNNLMSPYNQFYLNNNVNSPHNVISSLITSPWISPLSIKDTCTTASDNRAGVCIPKKACLASGGYVAGTCGILGSCCVFQGTCRTVISANETYFVSPAYPSTHKERFDPPICIFTLQRSLHLNKWPICQFKLNFDEFSLAPPINGTCGGKTDSFIVSGAVNFNSSGLPTSGACGDLTGQHMYLDVDPEKPDDPLLLIVNTPNEQRYNRRWSIRVQQIACHSPFKAPNGCLQYFTSESAMVESFNYRGNGRASAFPGSSLLPIREVPQYPTLQFIASPNYFNDLSYGVCIQKLPRMCAIKWQAVYFDFGGVLAGLSDVSSANSQTNGCVRNDGLATYGSDIGDYISIQGASRDGKYRLQNQFCGQRLNSLPQQDINDEIISYSKPFIMNVRTDNLAGLHALPQAPRSQRGFRLKYRQLPCK